MPYADISHKVIFSFSSLFLVLKNKVLLTSFYFFKSMSMRYSFSSFYSSHLSYYQKVLYTTSIVL